MIDHMDGGFVLKDQKGRLTNSQLCVLGFIASCGAEGCSETKQALAAKLQVSLKTVDRAIHRLRDEGLSCRWLASRKTARSWAILISRPQ